MWKARLTDEAGREKALKEFTLDRMLRETEKVYNCWSSTNGRWPPMEVQHAKEEIYILAGRRYVDRIP